MEPGWIFTISLMKGAFKFKQQSKGIFSVVYFIKMPEFTAKEIMEGQFPPIFILSNCLDELLKT